MTSTTEIADAELYDRGVATLLASWEANARGSDGAALLRLDGVSAAVFPTEPERGVYNNAVLDRDLDADRRPAAVDAMAAAYAEAGVEHYAAWVHESDEAMREELSGRGYSVEESTRAMGLALEDAATPDPEIGIEAARWSDYLDYLTVLGLPGLLKGVDPDAYHVLVAPLEGENVAATIAFDHEGDCGMFNLYTFDAARKRGLGGALTARLLQDARARGCTTASLQSSEMAETLYAGAGFRDLGRFLEFVPQAA